MYVKCMSREQHPERELYRAVVGLEAHRSSLLQNGLMSGMQTFPNHWDGVGVVTGLLVVVGRLVGIVLILLLVSQQVRVQVSEDRQTRKEQKTFVESKR